MSGREVRPEVGWDLRREMTELINSLGELRELAAMDLRRSGEQELITRALELLVHHQDLERCSVFVLRGEVLECVAGRNFDEQNQGNRRPGPPMRFRLGAGMMGLAAGSGRLQHAVDCGTDTRFVRRTSDEQPTGSLICAPMVSRNRVLGVVNAYHPESDHFQSWHEAVLLLFASALAHILSNNRVLRRILKESDSNTVVIY